MNYAKLELLSNEIWENGSYLSTKIVDEKVVNTYAYDGYFVDIIYDVFTNSVIEVIVDESFNLSPTLFSALNVFQFNLN
jgi:hypothetical protein